MRKTQNQEIEETLLCPQERNMTKKKEKKGSRPDDHLTRAARGAGPTQVDRVGKDWLNSKTTKERREDTDHEGNYGGGSGAIHRVG